MALKASGLNGVRLSLMGVAVAVIAGGVFTRMGVMGAVVGTALRLLNGTFTALGGLMTLGVAVTATAIGCGSKGNGGVGVVAGVTGAVELAAKVLNRLGAMAGALFESVGC